MPNLNNILVYFSPELILTIGALLVLGYDLFVRGRDALQPWLAVVTVLAAVGATLWLYTLPPPEADPVVIADSAGNVIASCGQYGIFEVRSDPGDAGGTGDVVRCGAYVVDGFTQFFRLLGGLATLMVILSGMAFMRGRTPFRGEFYAILLFATFAMNLMAGVNDLILIFLSIEFLSVSSYILTGYLRGDPLSIEGGLKYFFFGSITSAAMLYGLSLLYGATGSLSLPAIAEVLSDPESVLVAQIGAIVLPALIMILAGAGFKLALVPFHQWSPDAYHGAPTPVTSFLSVGPKIAGFAILLRVLMTAFGGPYYAQQWVGIAAGLALITIVLGNITALRQSNVKRMMAYSSIAQAGFIMVGLAAFGGAQLAGMDPLAAILVYLLAYLFTNLGAFAVIISVDDALGSSEISSYAGLMHRAPFLAVALSIFFLSLIGIPPLAGFIGKFSVFSAAVSSGQTGLAVAAVLMGVVSVAYYFRVIRAMFFGDAPAETTPVRAAPLLRLVIVVALVMTFVIGLYAGPFIELSAEAASALSPLADSMMAVIPGAGH